MKNEIGVVIPTYQAAKHLTYCLQPLLKSPLQPKILVIDSSSTDKTVDLARSMGVEVVSIAKEEFNHGTTREKARKILNMPIVVMMTQDAYPTSEGMLEKLVEPIQKKKASVAYARQLPHQGAGPLASFARQFNYPEKSHIRSIEDVNTYGVYTFFCSNSCAAYSNAALDEIGGFTPTLFGEDTEAVAKLLHRRYSIAYVAEATVYHSHDYTLAQEFLRHFDIGLSRNRLQEWLKTTGKDTTRGKDYVVSLLKHLYENHPSLIFYAIFQTAAKYAGYRLGEVRAKATDWFNRIFSD